jgi:plasmid stability protein
MASLHVRGLDDDVLQKLKARARRHGRSVQKEVEILLRDAANMMPRDTPSPSPLAGLHFTNTGGRSSHWRRESIYAEDGR